MLRFSRRGFLGSSIAAVISSPELNGKNVATCSSSSLPALRVHARGHMLETVEGTAFFWLGDTAWELIHSTTREECSYYLQTRAAQGFTVIQAVVLAEMDGVHKLSALGSQPFENDDPERPKQAYFQRVVEVVEEAARRGLYVALLPTWGDKLTAPWGEGPRLFRNDNLPVARSYAAHLARKVQHCTNVVWMLGGDRPARLDEHFHGDAAKYGFPENQDWTPIWNAMAEGITSVWPTPPLFLYHPQGGPISTSVLLRDARWLSVNGIQSGHGSGRDTPTWELIERDYNITPPKPVIDLEPNYEDHPVDPWPTWNPANGYFRDYDVRKQLYRSVLAGGCGVTYGHHSVWQFANKRNGAINHADRGWMDAMVRPGAQQVTYLRRLIESRPFFERVPDQSMIVTKYTNQFEHSQSTRDAEGRYAMIYVPNAGQKITLNLANIRENKRIGWWFDPRTGIGQRMDMDLSLAQVELQTPTHGLDWVVVIDDANQGFVPPGIVERCHA